MKIEKLINEWLVNNIDKLNSLHMQNQLNENEYSFWAKYFEGEALISPEQEVNAYLSLVEKLKEVNVNEK